MKFLTASLMLAVGACDSSVSKEERYKAEMILPKDCKIYEIGEYGSIHNLYVTVCEGKKTVTNSWSYTSGKARHEASSVTVGEQ